MKKIIISVYCIFSTIALAQTNDTRLQEQIQREIQQRIQEEMRQRELEDATKRPVEIDIPEEAPQMPEPEDDGTCVVVNKVEYVGNRVCS